jgi:hypothetical protein
MGAEMKNRQRDKNKEKETKIMETRVINGPKDTSRDEKRREAGKPLYLVRYE